MQSYIKINDKVYKAQLFWRDNKHDKTKDDNDKILPFPKEGKTWSMSSKFIDRLNHINNLIETKKQKNVYTRQNNKDCLLCNKKKISNKIYFLGKYLWDDNIIHYIKYHNSKPNEEFIDFIFDINLDKYFATNIIGRMEKDKDIPHLKLDRNQIMILDALMKHGGYTKKYYDINNKKISRYSEHAGFLETKNKTVYDVIVSGNTLRVDTGDSEIFLPGDMPKAFSFHYIFHTHPPTPKPGGRAIDGIIYEFPSVGDILHFIEHHNSGKTIGSLVMAPEGMYNIRKTTYDKDKIKINENSLYKEMKTELWNINKSAIKEYGSNFTTYIFYSKIAQDTKYINMINKKLEKYLIHIDFFPRTMDDSGKWIVDTIYIPLYDK
jgi:hypothetical protein